MPPPTTTTSTTTTTTTETRPTADTTSLARRPISRPHRLTFFPRLSPPLHRNLEFCTPAGQDEGHLLGRDPRYPRRRYRRHQGPQGDRHRSPRYPSQEHRPRRDGHPDRESGWRARLQGGNGHPRERTAQTAKTLRTSWRERKSAGWRAAAWTWGAETDKRGRRLGPDLESLRGDFVEFCGSGWCAHDAVLVAVILVLLQALVQANPSASGPMRCPTAVACLPGFPPCSVARAQTPSSH